MQQKDCALIITAPANAIRGDSVFKVSKENCDNNFIIFGDFVNLSANQIFQPMDTQQAVENARNFLSKDKSGAAWLAMIDVGEYINISAVSRNYFNKSTNWLSQRLHGYEVNGKPAKFKPNEYAQLSDALRDIARRLNESADRIDAANVDE